MRIRRIIWRGPAATGYDKERAAAALLMMPCEVCCEFHRGFAEEIWVVSWL